MPPPPPPGTSSTTTTTTSIQSQGSAGGFLIFVHRHQAGSTFRLSVLSQPCHPANCRPHPSPLLQLFLRPLSHASPLLQLFLPPLSSAVPPRSGPLPSSHPPALLVPLLAPRSVFVLFSVPRLRILPFRPFGPRLCIVRCLSVAGKENHLLLVPSVRRKVPYPPVHPIPPVQSHPSFPKCSSAALS